MFEAASDDELDLLLLERLGQIIIGALSDGLDRPFHGPEGRQEHDGGVRAALLEFPQHRDAVHGAHEEIRQDEVEAPLAAPRNRVGAVGGCLHVVAFLPQRLHQEVACDRVIIHHQDGSLSVSHQSPLPCRPPALCSWEGR